MNKTKKGIKHPLLLGMGIYAIVFLAAAALGLRVFWDFIGAYEASRPENTIDAYVSQLEGEEIAEGCGELVAMVDHDLQTEEECRQVILEAVSGGVTYAKKTSESTDSRMVYALRCGSRVIGTVTLGTVSTDEFGFSQWEVEQTEFDLSYLLEQPAAVTVPGEFTVAVNGRTLDEGYITESGIAYEVLEAFYDDYQLPTMVTYEAGPFLGDVDVEILAPGGESVVMDENTDYGSFLDNCSEDDKRRLAAFADQFLARYVAFTGSAHKSSENNYAKLLPYVVMGSDLHKRMSMALDGLSWAQSNGDRLISITYNHFISIGDGRYICDASYEVDTSGREGVVRTTNYVRFVIVDMAGGPRVEMLTSY